MWSAALDAILTTLRYLAPATLLTLFWGQQSFLFKLLKHIDSAFRAIVFSSEEQKLEVLEWIAEAGPVRVEHLETVWRHGWVLCGVLDQALPGACAGHPPTRLSLKHAQSIADHYLGVEPVFSRQELESNDSLSKHQEWKLATYLDRIREALTKITPPVSKPASQRTSPEATQFTLDYVAKGAGLTAAQVNNKAYFKIYPTSQQSLDPGDVTILIRGPKDTYGMTVLPPILGKAQIIRQKLLGLQPKPNYTEHALPLTQGTTYLRTYGKNDMNKTYFIPKTHYDVQIEVETREDHVKVGYTVTLEGKYEISITSKGQNIMGSPFTVTSSNNIIGILESDTFCLEDGEEIDIVDVETERKVVLRIVDFVTEKMLLRENGSLEKISDEEAKKLMAIDSEPEDSIVEYEGTTDGAETKYETKAKSVDFNSTVLKVIKMNKVCKKFQKIIKEKQMEQAQKQKAKDVIEIWEQTVKDKPLSRTRSQQDIPDIVNSTFIDSKNNPFLSGKKDKFIIPENISVSLRTEKSLPEKQKMHDSFETTSSAIKKQNEMILPHTMDIIETVENDNYDDTVEERPTSTNPFLNDKYEQNYSIEKDLGSFVKTEYETNNSQNEKTENTAIKIVIDNSDTPSPITTNPFIEPDIINMERPKTPVLKILEDAVQDREDTVYVDPKGESVIDEILGNEFINPFFIHHHHPPSHNEKLPIADFIIGAPVSLPPIIRATTPEPNMESILITDNKGAESSTSNNHMEDNAKQESTAAFSTPLQTNINRIKERLENNNSVSSTFHSLDSNITNNPENINISNVSDNQDDYEIKTNRDITPKKEMWDSAYVSIDDSNSSPDTNNNDSTVYEPPSKLKVSPSDVTYNFNMGPAEREIWESCGEFKSDTKACEDLKPKWELKRSLFTPIIEESDRSISSGMKDLKKSVQDPVTVAFTELNEMYKEYYPNSERTTSKVCEDNVLNNTDMNNKSSKSVDSASVLPDVKRHAEELEGKISEVQANFTESMSVSQVLHVNQPISRTQHIDLKEETQFGDKHHMNIVSEKKRYWDERIRQIEASSKSEDKIQPRKKRLSSRHLRNNDSLTRRRGKQIAKNFIKSEENNQKPLQSIETKELEIISRKSPIPHDLSLYSDVKLVEKWKKYWDNKLETECDETETTCCRAKSPKNKENLISITHRALSKDDIIQESKKHELSNKTSPHPVKQELPEEVFKAFETSPKRFFGTSRKQILNKIDTFLGKPSTADELSTYVSGANHDTGLVSSRISLFHNISRVEDLPWARRKCQSMQNIFQRKDSVDGQSLNKPRTNSTQSNSNDIQDDTPEKIKKSNTVIEKVEATNHFVKEPQNVSIKNKRARLLTKYNNSFDETQKQQLQKDKTIEPPSVKRAVTEYIKQNKLSEKPKINYSLRKSSISKSEMDIFSKTASKPSEDDLDKYKSCNELPKINIKSFISIYESASKSDVKAKPLRKSGRTSIGNREPNSLLSGAVNKRLRRMTTSESTDSESNTEPYTLKNISINKSTDSISTGSVDPKSFSSVEIDISTLDDKETTYVSYSDIELEIVENKDKGKDNRGKSNEMGSNELREKITKLSPEREEDTSDTDYKSRFKMAKKFFQSLEELRDIKKPKKLNECELLLIDKSTESLENARPQKRIKKNIKSHSMPSSEIAKIWNQLQESKKAEECTKIMTISEKFNVDDLFQDVMEGRLSRQGSLRGIPHKKAVLEAFRSMENLTDHKMNSYEITASQLSDFAKENHIKNAQTYLTEYPYLPTTDPSKYHSRMDAKAAGLISLKELVNQRPRRNSVPDLRLNPTFSVDL